MISGMILWAIGFNGYQGSPSQVLSPTATAQHRALCVFRPSIPDPFRPQTLTAGLYVRVKFI